MGLRVEAATTRDLDTVAALHADAVRWLASKGLDQWQPVVEQEHALQQRIRDRLWQSIERGECYLVYEGPEAVATVTVDEFADPEFWWPADQPESAMYVHRMAVKRSAAGRDLGALLLDWAEELAGRRGKRWIRLDAWRTNTELHNYYKRHGFAHVRTVSLDHRQSGALFQRAVPSRSYGKCAARHW